MQTTSATYDALLAGTHWFETKITIAGNDVAATSIMYLNRERNGMPEAMPSVGGALASTLNLRILTPNFTIPLLAEIDVFVRATDGTTTSEWLNQGTYFVDTRVANESVNAIGTVDITAYDSMAKANADYPDTEHEWPYTDVDVVDEIAAEIGVTVDSRTYTYLTSAYEVQVPTNYTMREVLENIAASYGGNFVITADNALLFVPLFGFTESNIGWYLADESDNALVFGNEGWCILVG